MSCNFVSKTGQIKNVISVTGAVIFKFHVTQATNKNWLANREILRNDISNLFPFTIALAKVFVQIDATTWHVYTHALLQMAIYHSMIISTKKKINKSRIKVLISYWLSHRHFSGLSPICIFAFVTDNVFELAFFGRNIQYSRSPLPLTRRNLSSISEDQNDRVYCIFLWNIKLTLS